VFLCKLAFGCAVCVSVLYISVRPCRASGCCGPFRTPSKARGFEGIRAASKDQYACCEFCFDPTVCCIVSELRIHQPVD